MRLVLLAATLLATGPLQAADKLPVVATFSIVGDMASVIGGEDVSVTTLVPTDGDAHSYEPRPSDLRALQAARVLVANGLGFEHWLDRLKKSARFAGVEVVAGSAVRARDMEEDGKRVTDPHAWQDPRNGVLYARAIAEGLSRADPVHAPGYRSRATAYEARILETDRFVEQTLSAIPRAERRMITSHDAFGYFAVRYGVTVIGVQGLSTEGEPSARDLARLADQIRRDRTKAIFVETMTDPRLAQQLAREVGAAVGPAVYSDALSASDGPAATYLAMFRHNAAAFAAAMAKNDR